jgi:hypothetical protein
VVKYLKGASVRHPKVLLVPPIVTLSRNIRRLLLITLGGEHVLKGRGPLNTTGEHEFGKVPELGQESKYGGVGQDGVRLGLDAIVNDLLSFNPRRDEVGRNTDTSSIKKVGEAFTVYRLAGVGVVILTLVNR